MVSLIVQLKEVLFTINFLDKMFIQRFESTFIAAPCKGSKIAPLKGIQYFMFEHGWLDSLVFISTLVLSGYNLSCKVYLTGST